MRAFLPIILVVLLACGCSTYEPKPISSAQTAAALEARRLDSAGLKNFLEQNGSTNAWPRRSWDLDTLTLAAFYFHPAVDTARAKWGTTRAEEVSAGARPNPTVGVTPEYSINPESGVSPWVAGLNFDIPIETAGKRGYRIARAKHLSNAARLEIANVAWQTRSRLRNALLTFASAQRRAELLKEQQSKQHEIVRLLEQQLKAGAVSQFDLAAPRIALTKTEIEYHNAESQIAEKRVAIAEAIGVPAEALNDIQIVVEFNTTSTVAPAVAELRHRALETRPDILIALSDYAASQAALQLEIAKQYPDVHLGTGYQYDQGQNKWSLGLTMELPVLNRNEGGVAEAKARRTETAARFVELQAQIIAEIDRAHATFEAARKHLRATDELLNAQRQQGGALEEQFKAGAIDRATVAVADLDLSTAELARAEVVTQIHEAFGAIEDAVQAPLAATNAPWEGAVSYLADQRGHIDSNDIEQTRASAIRSKSKGTHP